MIIPSNKMAVKLEDIVFFLLKAKDKDVRGLGVWSMLCYHVKSKYAF